MHELVFDIETNAIEDWDELSDLRVIHCIAIQDPTKDEVEIYSDSYGDDKNIIHGLVRLGLADRIIGHNIDRFDMRAIKKFYPSFSYADCHTIDTLLASRIMSPDVVRTDCQDPEFPSKLRGRYSLEAWGHRLKFNKGDYGKQTDWSEFTPEMAEYCAQDVRLNTKLWLEIRKTFTNEVYSMERDFRDILIEQESNGVVFDEEAAFKLHTELIGKKIEIENKMTEVFPAQEEFMKTPQYYFDPDTDKKYERKKDAPYSVKKNLKPGPLRKRVVPFNPGSRLQIANALIKMYDWKPKEFTGDGRPKVDETVLSKLKYPEAKILSEYLMICKRIGQLSDGRESWIRSSRDGRIHGHVQSMRCLAHYLAKWDKGEYIKVLQEGDIHQFNADKMGVERGPGKGIMYATLYGAGDAKIGQLVGGGRREGRSMRNLLESGIPALKMLKRAIANRLKTQDWLPAIDGRRLPIRSEHAALNLLLQSAGSILMKQATIKMNRYIRQNNLQANQIMHVHDEVQFEALESEADDVGRIAVQSMREAGEPYEFRCPLDGEYKIGHSWADTH